MRTSNATKFRAERAEGYDQALLRKLKSNDGLTANDIVKLTGIKYSTLKNQLQRMFGKGYLRRQIEIYNNRTHWRWWVTEGL